ncbi:hypothetical protein L1049_008787 [Liquidambar formosana]|uniref:MADS-box domain-containing protein n=1 Tax=Liquidambar formosana TaxID=63359 RepID=A0AAP0SA75_LIQFO
MGRGKLNMDLIRNEKSRYSNFRMRKKGLMKKTYELATLCGIDACIIVFGPKFGCHPIEIETWPQNPDETERRWKAKSIERHMEIMQKLITLLRMML